MNNIAVSLLLFSEQEDHKSSLYFCFFYIDFHVHFYSNIVFFSVLEMNITDIRVDKTSKKCHLLKVTFREFCEMQGCCLSDDFPSYPYCSPFFISLGSVLFTDAFENTLTKGHKNGFHNKTENTITDQKIVRQGNLNATCQS